jgi:hypothetical protein
MSQQPSRYRGYRFPREVIAHAVWLYRRFGLGTNGAESRFLGLNRPFQAPFIQDLFSAAKYPLPSFALSASVSRR